MNKTAIKNFAIWARNKLIADVKYRAGLLGVTENGIANAAAIACIRPDQCHRGQPTDHRGRLRCVCG